MILSGYSKDMKRNLNETGENSLWKPETIIMAYFFLDLRFKFWNWYWYILKYIFLYYSDFENIWVSSIQGDHIAASFAKSSKYDSSDLE